jgi:hypothetical protein
MISGIHVLGYETILSLVGVGKAVFRPYLECASSIWSFSIYVNEIIKEERER